MAIRTSQVVAEPVLTPDPNARVSQVVAEPVLSPDPNACVSQVAAEAVITPDVNARVSQIVAEVIVATWAERIEQDAGGDSLNYWNDEAAYALAVYAPQSQVVADSFSLTDSAAYTLRSPGFEAVSDSFSLSDEAAYALGGTGRKRRPIVFILS